MESYKYFGVELTPNIFAELLVLLFEGKQFDRVTAVNQVTEYHKNNGGLLRKNDYISTFKKACNALKKKGKDLQNINSGIWRLNCDSKNIEVVTKKEENTSAPMPVDRIIGEGNQSIYVYYYDIYEKYAESQGKDIWECKVGRTNYSPLQRILSQAGTCYPELPHIALIINCENSDTLESALHNVLKLRNRHLKSAPGTEWFLTNPFEIESIYNFIKQKTDTCL